MYHYGYYGPGSFFGGFFGWLILVLVIIAIFKLATRHKRREYWMNKMHNYGFGKDSAMEIIREKYAKGEITKEEFEAKKKDLSS